MNAVQFRLGVSDPQSVIQLRINFKTFIHVIRRIAVAPSPQNRSIIAPPSHILQANVASTVTAAAQVMR